MTHDDKKEHKHDHNDHGHDHSHHHDHDHDHHHHHDGDHHHWDRKDYVARWIARDEERAGERKAFLDRLVAAVPFAHDAAISVLDVGGGAGAMSAAILQAFPRVKITIADYSEPMLEHARERFAANKDMRFVQCDLADPAWEQKVGGPFDLAVSGIAIHNLGEMSKIAACYQAIYRLMRKGGVFLDYDHFDRCGGLPLHEHSLKVAGFAVETVWHDYPTAVVKAAA